MPEEYFKHETAIVEDGAEIGRGSKIWHHAHIRTGSKIGSDCNIGKNCYVDKGAVIGSRVKLQNNVSVWHGVKIEDEVFIGPGVTLTNDLYPRAFIWDDARVATTLIKKGASVGANSTILCGNRVIGEYAMVGAGSVVTKDVPPHGLVVGNPARLIGHVCKCGMTLKEKTTSGAYKCSSCGAEIRTDGSDSKPKMVYIASPVIGEKEQALVREVLQSGMLAQGPKVAAFEQKFAELCGAKFAVAVNSGTAALHCCNYALGIKPGDEVITVSFTFVATANSIIMQGARPVFVDVREDTFNIDPKKIEAAITPKTKAILAVDLYGQPADYDAIHKIAKKHNLKVIEDAAQSVFAEYKGKKAGNLTDIAGFSFYATKNLITGEGGMITTNNEEMAELCRRFRHHGQSEKTRYEYFDLGYNYRMTDLSAAIGLVQMERISELTEQRQKNAEIITSGLKNVKGIITPITPPGLVPVYHQYTVRVTKDYPMSRDQLAAYLKENGFGCGVYYPKPLHMHPHFINMGYKEGDFPVSERLAKEVLSLPVHPKLTRDELDKLIRLIKEAK